MAYKLYDNKTITKNKRWAGLLAVVIHFCLVISFHRVPPPPSISLKPLGFGEMLGSCRYISLAQVL